MTRTVAGHGVDPPTVYAYHRLPSAEGRHVVRASRAGYLTRLDAELVGRASVALGAGRDRIQDNVDPGVGVVVHAKPGDAVAKAEAVLELHYRDPFRLERAIALATQAVEIGETAGERRALLVGEIP